MTSGAALIRDKQNQENRVRYSLARLAITKYNITDWEAYNGNVLPHSSGGWESEVTVAAGIVSGEASARGWQMATFSLCPHEALTL